MNLPDGIKVYEYAVKIILGWMPNWISQDDFDELRLKEKPVHSRLVSYTPETYMLGSIEQAGVEDLDLLQHMQVAGLVDAKECCGLVFYKASSRKNSAT